MHFAPLTLIWSTSEKCISNDQFLLRHIIFVVDFIWSFNLFYKTISDLKIFLDRVTKVLPEIDNYKYFHMYDNSKVGINNQHKLSLNKSCR